MTYRELYFTIENGPEREQRKAALKLLNVLRATATAALELAGETARRTDHYPLSDNSRLTLSDFIELKTEREPK